MPCIPFAALERWHSNGLSVVGLRADMDTVPRHIDTNKLPLALRLTLSNPEPTMNYNVTATTPADRIKQAEAELAAAVQAKQEQDERDALVARFDNDRHLAEATISLISRARSLRLKSSCEGSNEFLARFRKELTPLAESYGVRIVLTGDKSTATVVLA